jgi:hypothetical protein
MTYKNWKIMKTTLFVMITLLASGAVFAQKITATNNQTATTQAGSVKAATSASGQLAARGGNTDLHTASSSGISANFEKENKAAMRTGGQTVNATAQGANETAFSSNVSPNFGAANKVTLGSGTQTVISADRAAGNAAIVAGEAQHTGNVAIKQTTKTGVRAAAKIVTDHPVRANAAMRSAIKVTPVKAAARLGTNLGVGIK